MLVHPRTYTNSQRPDRGLHSLEGDNRLQYHSFSGWRTDFSDEKRAAEMLLVHQAGSVRVGEVVRYTLTYTPSLDPILPPPAKLFVKIKNTSASPLRAAYLHGPYTLYVACYPLNFDPNIKYDGLETEGAPQFESYLKAGGTWDANMPVPDRLRQVPLQPSPFSPTKCEGRQSMTWIIEIVSQVVFSATAAVNFELLVGRNKKSLDCSGIAGLPISGLAPPAHLHEHFSTLKKGTGAVATKGVYSASVHLKVDDTSSLWNTPPLPNHEEDCSMQDECPNLETSTTSLARGPENSENQPRKSNNHRSQERTKKKKIHLVILTHGLHSNLSADMLYLKESIDKATQQARSKSKHDTGKSLHSQFINEIGNPDTNDFTQGSNLNDDEQVIVRGFPGNAVRTERGIQYLGKRLAKYILLMTYPDQPYHPLSGSKNGPTVRSFKFKGKGSKFSHNSYLETQFRNQNEPDHTDAAYTFTSISFIGHSLGGLVQTYAIAYIQKYSPDFFDKIKPINFIALATPFLGLSNENPMYVRFALDLGLVGRTGQDLGLSWTAPKVRSGWGAVIGGRGAEGPPKQAQSSAEGKPLLRILPSGPAHEALLKFQCRTVYCNVVNDGIVPLRTSCLLFLDWRGLDRVEKARRDNGLVGTMAEWGWAELTGAKSKSPRSAQSPGPPFCDLSINDEGLRENEVALADEPPAPKDLTAGDPLIDPTLSPSPTQFLASSPTEHHDSTVTLKPTGSTLEGPSLRVLSNVFSIFQLKGFKHATSHKSTKIYKRSQTLPTSGTSTETTFLNDNQFPSGDDIAHAIEDGLYAPPKTTFFESAGDLLMPPLAPIGFIVDPSSRPVTIFHDRVYHPEDIPPPHPMKRHTLGSILAQDKRMRSSFSSAADSTGVSEQYSKGSESGLKVEEKIARAYHQDLSWRKVLVRLEPDAHNNIIVRRMFTNAYGWPVIRHLVDMHFANRSDDTEYYRRGR
ncbi:hypothetical protein ASPZODRAFT_134227 [Penicilliopsis zonata CBS 506.65]|uniref:DUF676 domain-containing protein n=1 Tax=Penicilliopsis zonata CBS 506.65 TaxID=1073090 RepID=A0A1L9SEF8_9EURO|nr:hypothetical protein ASPZODRAFT_134227 [Penicilliopsis zonata CBS 506.65]OJJ45542.1 hypothetical protein ASPZODRAFT_134227 [Penicilliopsis zonata CBS 506.65]